MHFDMTTMLVVGLVGIGIGLIISALLVMLGAKLVMGAWAKFGSAIISVLGAVVVAIVAQIVIGIVFGIAMPGQVIVAGLASLAASVALTAWIYTMLLETGDGRKPDFGQGLLIWLVQFLIALAFGAAIFALAVFVFQVPMPQIPGVNY